MLAVIVHFEEKVYAASLNFPIDLFKHIHILAFHDNVIDLMKHAIHSSTDNMLPPPYFIAESEVSNL